MKKLKMIIYLLDKKVLTNIPTSNTDTRCAQLRGVHLSIQP